MDTNPIDLPNQRCQLLRVGQLMGTRCIDTVSLTTVTTVDGQGRIFLITAKNPAPSVYQQMIESLRATG